ncbi:hypothetical protein LTS02_006368 [Friedmanniomyces endolithicus]|nr:hypothetical protein LTS02_006368 [Friedmanniomyces endolithicus]
MSGNPIYTPPPGPPPSYGSQLAEGDEGDNDDEIEASHTRLVSDIKDYLITHGHLLKLVRFETPSRVPAVGVNVSCQPTPFPCHLFQQATSLQSAMNELYIRAASDDAWLYSVLRLQIEGEPAGLLASLWDVWVKCREAGVVQSVSCAIVRSDYMLHVDAEREAEVGLRQVEMNTFSVAGACHAEGVASMHRWLMRKETAEMGNADTSESSSQLDDLPPNTNTSALVSGLSAAHSNYQDQFPTSHPKCILMVVQAFNFNIGDERPLEYGLLACYRCEWREVLSRCHKGSDRELFYSRPGNGKDKSSKLFEVSVVYYRAGYDAEEYTEESGGKDIRLMLELSRAIKCPDVQMHLVGMKSVQRALAEPGIVAQFLPDARRANEVMGTFMPMLPLDSTPQGLEARRLAMDPMLAVDYVLKPNLEGGGHNVFRTDIPAYLSRIPEEDWERYILMRLITPPISAKPGMLLTGQEVYEGPVVSELGVLGFALWQNTRRGATKQDGPGKVEIMRNETLGWTFKTKPTGVDEMSVVKGKRQQPKAPKDAHSAGQAGTPEQSSARQHQEQKKKPNSDDPKAQRSGRLPWTKAKESEAQTSPVQEDSTLAHLSLETSEMQKKLRSASRTPESDTEEVMRKKDRESLKLLEVATAKQRRQERTGVRAFVSTTTESEMAEQGEDWTVVSQDGAEQLGEMSGVGSLLAISPASTSTRALLHSEHHDPGLVSEEQRKSAGDHVASTTASDGTHSYHFTPSDSSSDTSTTPSQAASRALRREHWQQDDDPRFAYSVESLVEGRKERVLRRASGGSVASDTLLDAMHDWAPTLVQAYIEVMGRRDKLIEDLGEQLLKVEGRYEELRRGLWKASKPSKVLLAEKKALAEKALLAEEALLAENGEASSDVAEQASAPRELGTPSSLRSVERAVTASTARVASEPNGESTRGQPDLESAVSTTAF